MVNAEHEQLSVRKTSVSNVTHKKYPYLLRDLKIRGVNHVWETDITYIKRARKQRIRD